jgi:hypothetical protein
VSSDLISVKVRSIIPSLGSMPESISLGLGAEVRRAGGLLVVILESSDWSASFVD